MSDIEAIFDTDTEPAPVETKKLSSDDVMVIPLSSFDFLEGKFRAAARTRFMNTMTMLLVVALVSIGLLQTLDARLSQSDVSARLNAVNAELTQARAALTEEQQAGGATPEEVDAHVKVRAGDAVTVLTRQVAYRTVIAAITDVGPGLQVSQITFSPGEGNSGLGMVLVSGRARDGRLGGEIVKVLSDPARYPYFTTPTGPEYAPSVSCGSASEPVGDSSETDSANLVCEWSWAGVLTDQAITARMAELSAQYNVTPNKPETESTDKEED